MPKKLVKWSEVDIGISQEHLCEILHNLDSTDGLQLEWEADCIKKGYKAFFILDALTGEERYFEVSPDGIITTFNDEICENMILDNVTII